MTRPRMPSNIPEAMGLTRLTQLASGRVHMGIFTTGSDRWRRGGLSAPKKDKGGLLRVEGWSARGPSTVLGVES